MNWPKRLKSVAVVSTPRPVTVTALVEVNAASIQEIDTSEVVAAGNLRRSVPKSMMPANPRISRRGACARDKRMSVASLLRTASSAKPGRSKPSPLLSRRFSWTAWDASSSEARGFWPLGSWERLFMACCGYLLPRRIGLRPKGNSLNRLLKW